MAVIFEFEAGKGFHFANAFANHFGMPEENYRVNVPEMLGDGFIQEVYLSNGLVLCLHRYTLKQEFIMKRLANASTTMVTMKFDCRRAQQKLKGVPESLFAESNCYEAEFASSDFFTELIIPANQPILFLVVSTARDTLLNMLKFDESGYRIETIVKNSQSFVLHEHMTQGMERTLKQISEINNAATFADLLYQSKAQELIYLLFTKLLSRTESTPLTVHPGDAKKMYEIRDYILADVSVPPKLQELATSIGMSLSKMKQLFNQIFGKSIYNYYQLKRMDEAAALLGHLSVSETGYELGFTNLSHFSRLFEKHYQMKPKRYKDTMARKKDAQY